MLVDPTFLHTPMDIILLNSSLIPSCHFSCFPDQDSTMPAGRLVVQMDHSFQWLQMHSHLTIHVGWILF